MIAADRTYGGMKDSCIRVIRNFLNNNRIEQALKQQKTLIMRKPTN